MADEPLKPDDDYPYAATSGLQVVSLGWKAQAAGKEPYIDAMLQEHDGPIVHLPTESQVVAVVCLGVGLLAFNAAFCPIAEVVDSPSHWAAFFIPWGIGVFFAQCAALSTALVFGANPLWLRLIMHWLAAIALLSAWLIGMLIGDLNVLMDDVWIVLVGVPLVSLAAQLPLWIARLYFQWRIVGEDLAPANGVLRPLSIGDIMLGTVVVALTFAVARSGPIPAGVSAADYWLGYSIAMAVAGGISVVFIPRLLSWTLRVENIAWGALGIVCYAAAWIAVWFTLVWVFPVLRNAPWFIVPGLILGYTTTLSGMFWLARACGYRLKIGRSERAAGGEAST